MYQMDNNSQDNIYKGLLLPYVSCAFTPPLIVSLCSSI